jgi:chromosome segregation ATPase
MPRGIKGSKKTTTQKKTVAAKKVNTTEKKPRKAYPSIDERIDMAEKQIKRLTGLIESRKTLIQKTEAALNTRKSALQKSTTQLEKAQNRKQALVARKNKPAKEPGPKLSAEELKVKRVESLAKARAAKKAEKEKYEQLLSALKESGKSVEDLLKEVRG